MLQEEAYLSNKSSRVSQTVIFGEETCRLPSGMQIPEASFELYLKNWFEFAASQAEHHAALLKASQK